MERNKTIIPKLHHQYEEFQCDFGFITSIFHFKGHEQPNGYQQKHFCHL